MKQIVVIICLLAVVVCNSTAEDSPRLAISLVKKHSSELAQIKTASPPLLTDADIVSYDWQDHSLVLTDGGLKKLLHISKDVGTGGTPFVVAVNGQPCYLGAFYTRLSSTSHPNPVIVVSFGTKDKTVKIERSYPSAKFAEGNDPRSDKRIRKALTELKKLKETPNQANDSDKE